MANVQLVLNQTQNGVPIKNVTNWQTPDGSTLTIQELVNGIRASWDGAFKTSFPTSWQLENVTARVYDGAPPFSTVFPFTLGILAGTAITAELPRQSALLVSTAFNGPRPNRGRIFFGGLSEGAWDGGAWDTTTQADALSMVNNWISGIGTTAGTCFLRIARPDDVTNTWTLDNPAETAVIRTYASTQKGRRQSNKLIYTYKLPSRAAFFLLGDNT